MTIRLELGESNRRPRIIVMGSTYRDANKLKSIPGCRVKNTGRGTDKTFEYWHFPLDLTTAHLIRQSFPGLEMDELLWEWGVKERAHRRFIRQLHYGGTKHEIRPLRYVPKAAPGIWRAMQDRGYQTVVPEFARRVGSHFNADQPGLGKTIEELGALVECRITGKILIIAPRKALRATWGPQIRQWMKDSKFKIRIIYADSVEGSGDDREQIIKEFVRRPDQPNEMNFLLINPEMARYDFVCPGEDGEGKDRCRGNSRTCAYRKQHHKGAYHPSLFRIEWNAILLDETHKFMMHANTRSASVSRVGFGLQDLTSDYKVGMSGTPFKGKPRLFWMMLHWLRPDMYTAQGRWQEAYFETQENHFVRSKKVITEEMRSDREWLYNQELDMIMIRRTKRELHNMNPSWAPPDKRYVIVPVEMEPKQRRAYESMRDDALVRLGKGMLLANGHLAEMTRLKQLASCHGKIVKQPKIIKQSDGRRERILIDRFQPALPSCKWDWIEKVFLAERGILDNDGTIKVGICSQYVEILKLYSAQLTRLKVPHFLVSGGMKEKIEHVQEQFQRKYRPGDPRVILLSTRAGTSFNFDAADDVVLNDETGVPDEEEQAEDRFHRTSRTDHQVTVYRLQTVGTIDERLIVDAEIKDETQKKLLDGRRGVDYFKHIIENA